MGIKYKAGTEPSVNLITMAYSKDSYFTCYLFLGVDLIYFTLFLFIFLAGLRGDFCFLLACCLSFMHSFSFLLQFQPLTALKLYLLKFECNGKKKNLNLIPWDHFTNFYILCWTRTTLLLLFHAFIVCLFFHADILLISLKNSSAPLSSNCSIFVFTISSYTSKRDCATSVLTSQTGCLLWVVGVLVLVVSQLS